MGIDKSRGREQAGCVDALGINGVKAPRLPKIGDFAASDQNILLARLASAPVADFPALYDDSVAYHKALLLSTYDFGLSTYDLRLLTYDL